MKFPICLLLIFFILLSCRHDTPVICEIEGEEFTREKSIQQMKDYLLFDVGTYWIYEEETTGALDTVTVYYSWEGIAQEVNEAFRMEAHSSLEDYNYYYLFNSSFDNECLTDDRCICLPCKIGKGKPGDFIGEGFVYLFPIILDNFIYVQTGQTLLSDIYESYTLNGNTFYSTAEIITDVNLSEGGQSTKIFISEHIGIIRKELLNDNLVWNLIEWSIYQ